MMTWKYAIGYGYTFAPFLFRCIPSISPQPLQLAISLSTSTTKTQGNQSRTPEAMASAQVIAVAAPPPVDPPAAAAFRNNRIRISNNKRPLFFYVNLAKRYMRHHEEVELCALGMAITTVVSVAEILKNTGFALAKKVSTSTVGTKDEVHGRTVQKAKIEIVLEKTDKFMSLITANSSSLEKTESSGDEKKEEVYDSAASESSGDEKEKKV